MNSWHIKPLGEVIDLQRGHDLPTHRRKPGSVPILGSFGITGTHSEAKYSGPGVSIGRSGAAIGTATYTHEAYWPLNTCLFVSDFKGNDPRWVYRFLDLLDFNQFNSGSAQPSLNRNFLRDIPISVPSVQEQRAIAEVLGTLDDKIAANTTLARTADELASSKYSSAVESAGVVPMSQKLTPILGGTPSRSRDDYWGGDQRWISAKDVTSAFGQLILDTEEKITTLAAENTKAKPLPKGSVIMTARGTVGAVARLGEPSSFNQSCYGFIPGDVPASILYFAVRSAADHAKSMAHGSVFDTITKKTFDHLVMPELASDDANNLDAVLSPLLSVVESSARENLKLAGIRDALLPQLMSGKLRVKDAEKVVEGAI